jgi:hypothetical protein
MPDTPPDALAQAPLLYIHAAVKEFPKTADAQVLSVLAAGGTVVVQPFGADKDILAGAKAYFARLLPQYEAGDVPDNHPIFSLHFKLPAANRPGLFALGDGCRKRVFILTSDVSGAWHQGRAEQYPQFFQLAANMLLYTTDLGPPKGRFRAGYARPRPPKPARSIRLARLKHAGDWDLCPQAVDRLGDALAEAVSIGLTELPPADPDKPLDANCPLLWMTGTRDPKLQPAQKDHLKAYLRAGGTLFIDSAMGAKEFTEAAGQALTEMFGAGSLQPLPGDHPLLTGALAGGMGSSIAKVAYTRAAAAEAPPGQTPELMCVVLNGRVAAVLCPYSVVCPLAGQPVYNCRGLAVRDAARLAANVVLYAATPPAGR